MNRQDAKNAKKTMRKIERKGARQQKADDSWFVLSSFLSLFLASLASWRFILRVHFSKTHASNRPPAGNV
jgi:hypothetical protein